MLALSLHAIDGAVSDFAASMGAPGESLFRLTLAAVLGGLIGIEREMHGRQAGFRTNLLVCVGSALVMVVSVSFASARWDHQPNVNITLDPARLAYGVMSGIGFLGAGVILKHNGAVVRGLTTAAGLWCVAAIGLACGLGLYLVAIAATALVGVALLTLLPVQKLVPRWQFRLVTLRRAWAAGVVAETVKMVDNHRGVRVAETSFERHGEGLGQVDIHIHVTFSRFHYYLRFEREVERRSDCELVASKEP